MVSCTQVLKLVVSVIVDVMDQTTDMKGCKFCGNGKRWAHAFGFI